MLFVDRTWMTGSAAILTINWLIMETPGPRVSAHSISGNGNQDKYGLSLLPPIKWLTYTIRLRVNRPQRGKKQIVTCRDQSLTDKAPPLLFQRILSARSRKWIKTRFGSFLSYEAAEKRLASENVHSIMRGRRQERIGESCDSLLFHHIDVSTPGRQRRPLRVKQTIGVSYKQRSGPNVKHFVSQFGLREGHAPEKPPFHKLSCLAADLTHQLIHH